MICTSRQEKKNDVVMWMVLNSHSTINVSFIYSESLHSEKKSEEKQEDSVVKLNDEMVVKSCESSLKIYDETEMNLKAASITLYSNSMCV